MTDEERQAIFREWRIEQAKKWSSLSLLLCGLGVMAYGSLLDNGNPARPKMMFLSLGLCILGMSIGQTQRAHKRIKETRQYQRSGLRRSPPVSQEQPQPKGLLADLGSNDTPPSERN